MIARLSQMVCLLVTLRDTVGLHVGLWLDGLSSDGWLWVGCMLVLACVGWLQGGWLLDVSFPTGIPVPANAKTHEPR